MGKDDPARRLPGVSAGTRFLPLLVGALQARRSFRRPQSPWTRLGPFACAGVSGNRVRLVENGVDSMGARG